LRRAVSFFRITRAKSKSCELKRTRIQEHVSTFDQGFALASLKLQHRTGTRKIATPA
jgi:hypothetical protein